MILCVSRSWTHDKISLRIKGNIVVEIHFRKKKKTAQHGTYLVLFLEWSAIKRYVLLLFLFRFPLKAQRYKKYIFSPDLLAKRLFSLSFCVSFPPLLPCSRFCSPSLCRRCRPSSQREERYLGFLRSSLSRSSCRRGGGQRKEDFVRGPTGEERERESDFLGGGGRERLPPPPPLPPFPPLQSVCSLQHKKGERERRRRRRRKTEREQQEKSRSTRHSCPPANRTPSPPLPRPTTSRGPAAATAAAATPSVCHRARPGRPPSRRQTAGGRAAARRRNRTPESFLGTLSAAALRTHPRRRLSPESSQTG